RTTTDSTGTSTESYVYDPAGNTTTRPEQELTWDAENHLATVTENGKTTSYLYDTSGNRLISRTPTETTLHLGHTEVTLATGADQAKATRYVSLGGGHTAIRSDDGSFAFTIADHHGTGELAIQANNLSITQRRTLPFGEIRGQTPTNWPGTKGFVGGTDDTKTTGLTHLGAREYDPDTGRFISVDPILDLSDPQQMHGYTYANNNPATLSDPSGLRPDGACGGAHQCSADTGSYTKTDDGWEYKDKATGSSGGSGSANPTGDNSGSANGSDERPVVGGEPIPTKAELYYSGYSYGKPASYSELIVKWAQNKCSSDSGTDFCKAAHDLGWISPTEDFLELIGVRDAMRCVGGSASSCVWTVAGLIPVGKIAKIAKIAKMAKRGKCNSFLPDTSVLMADGTRKAIADVEVGDKVLATDPETGETIAKTVTAEILGQGPKTLVRVTFDPNGNSEAASITATAGHPFWVAELRQWVDAEDLRAGQHLRTSAGKLERVADVKNWAQVAKVYNLTVADLHTYYVLAGSTPVLVHNSSGNASIDDFRGGSYFHTVLNTAQGNIDVGAFVEIDGNKLVLDNVAIYGADGDLPRGSVGASDFLALKRNIIEAAAAQGFGKLEVNWLRTSSGPENGKSGKWNIDLPKGC
ncbi:polymorphic toxin-type HINT domain-containing protein, partial [Streptomyces sp. NBC_01237]